VRRSDEEKKEVEMKFDGKILVIGLGAVSRCTLPLIKKHIIMPMSNVTVMDFADNETEIRKVKDFGMNFVKDRVTRDNMTSLLEKYVGSGDMIIDLAWNIDCAEILQWCRDTNVRYVNTSVEVWDPYGSAKEQHPCDRTLYFRHMNLRRMMAQWADNNGPTAVLDHGANPGLVQHFVKQGLDDMARKWLSSKFAAKVERKEKVEDALKNRKWNHLARELGVKVIHISERDTQVGSIPKRFDEFVNTWSIEGFYEEGIAPAEMGWGTHERTLPPRAQVHEEGPRHQICIANMGSRTWVRSLVPCGEIVGMVIRHGEAFSIPEYLTVYDEKGVPIYRPTCHYAYCPCDAAVASLHELEMRNFKIQPRLRIMTDEITEGRDELGCLLMGHDFKSWWIGSTLDINDARKLVPGHNATVLQVACSVLAASMWMMENPNMGVNLPDYLPHDKILGWAKPYLGPLVSQAYNWTPLKNWNNLFEGWGVQKPKEEDAWQFSSFLIRY